MDQGAKVDQRTRVEHVGGLVGGGTEGSVVGQTASTLVYNIPVGKKDTIISCTQSSTRRHKESKW